MTSRRNQDEPEEQADVIDDTHKCWREPQRWLLIDRY
jgi:hypothetical protein